MNPKSFSSIILFYLFQLSRAPPPPRLLSFLIVLIRTFLYFLLEEIRNEFVIFWRKIHLKWITKYCNLCCFILMFCVLEIWRIYRATKIQEILPKGQWGPKKTSTRINRSSSFQSLKLFKLVGFWLMVLLKIFLTIYSFLPLWWFDVSEPSGVAVQCEGRGTLAEILRVCDNACWRPIKGARTRHKLSHWVPVY